MSKRLGADNCSVVGNNEVLQDAVLRVINRTKADDPFAAVTMIVDSQSGSWQFGFSARTNSTVQTPSAESAWHYASKRALNSSLTISWHRRTSGRFDGFLTNIAESSEV